MSASLIGRFGSSAFRLSTSTVSMSLAGSCFSSDSAQHRAEELAFSPIDCDLVLSCCVTKIFSRLHCGRETRGFGIAGSARKTLGFKPQQIE